jgi:hypothetical protein
MPARSIPTSHPVAATLSHGEGQLAELIGKITAARG